MQTRFQYNCGFVVNLLLVFLDLILVLVLVSDIVLILQQQFVVLDSVWDFCWFNYLLSFCSVVLLISFPQRNILLDNCCLVGAVWIFLFQIIILSGCALKISFPICCSLWCGLKISFPQRGHQNLLPIRSVFKLFNMDHVFFTCLNQVGEFY